MSDRIYIHVKLGDLLRPNSHKVAISLPELVTQTNAFSVKNRPGCQPRLLKSNPKDLYLEYNVKCNLPSSDPAGHDVHVHFDIDDVEKTGDAKDLDVRVSCSCKAFLYWGAQWNLHQRDGLEGDPRPLLQAPTERLDLRTNFVICKHCKAVFERILPSVQHNVNNIIRKREVEKNKERMKEEPLTPRQKKLQDEAEKMKQREQERRKTRKKKEDDILENLSQREEERLRGEKNLTPLAPGIGEEEVTNQDHVVTRDEPATDAEKELVQEPQETPKPEPEAIPEPEPSEPSNAEPEAAPEPKKPMTDRELLEALREKEQRRLERDRGMKRFLDQKYKRRSSLEEEDEGDC